MKKLIKRIIERLYYKCYPDRVNDHFIATRSIIPVIHEGRDIVNLKTEIYIPKEMIDTIPRDFIRRELSYKFTKMIEPAIEIKEERDRYIGAPVIYTGLISIVRRRDYGS